MIAKFYSEVLNCLLLNFSSCVALADAGNEVYQYGQDTYIDCKIGEFGDSLEALLSWSGIYGVFMNYYYYEKPVQSALFNAYTSWSTGNWYQLGKDAGEVYRMLFKFSYSV